MAKARVKAKEGLKFDGGKLRLDLIPPNVIHGLGESLTYGANKYGDHNWERGIKYSRVFAALMRHLWAWWKGSDFDDESHLRHLHHALACLTFLVEYENRPEVFRSKWDNRTFSGLCSICGKYHRNIYHLGSGSA